MEWTTDTLICVYYKLKKKENMFNNEGKDSRTFMIRCEIDECSHKLYEVCKMRFCHRIVDKKNLKYTVFTSY